MNVRRQALAVWICVLSLCLVNLGSAAEKTYRLTVRAGGHDRVNTPVCVPITIPQELAKAGQAALTTSDGKRLPAQLTPPCLLAETAAAPAGMVRCELHFILPELKKGQSLELAAAFSDGAAQPGFAWRGEPGQWAELSHRGRPVMRYMYQALDASTKESRDATSKVYHHLYDPTGKLLVTKGPGGLFTHHRGLFYGFSRITFGDGQKANSWACFNDDFQSHDGFLGQAAGPVLGRHAVAVGWHTTGNTVYAKEQRELTVFVLPGGTLVQFASRLASTVGKLKLDGDPQHAGFQFRAAQEVAENQKLTYYLRPDGRGEPGETRNWTAKIPDPACVNLPWHACSFVIGDQRYTAAYFDHPRNPREARYSERGYARFGCYFEYELDAGRTLDIRYRVGLQSGEMTAGQVQALAVDFTEPPAVEVR